MADYTDSLGFTRGGYGHPSQGVDRVSVATVDLDFAQIEKARAKAGATALAANDSLQVLAVPAGVVVQNVGWRVIKKEETAPTARLSLGRDASNADTYVAAATVAAEGYAGGVPVLDTGEFSPANSGGLLYTTNGAIVAKITTAVPKDAVVRVFATMIDVS